MATKAAVLRLGNVTVDCADPIKLAQFWSEVLGREVNEGATEFFASIGQEDDGQVGWFFIKVPEGKQTKNRVHFDLRADDRDAAIERLVSLGATKHSEHDEYGMRWTTMLDVERNEFCVA